MADQLYLSLWFPNFRFDTLPATLVSVMRQFALISGDKRVAAASVYPISFTEAPTYQRIYVNDDRAEDTSGSIIENAVAEATEQLHDDMAYEFEMRWKLWTPDRHRHAGHRIRRPRHPLEAPARHRPHPRLRPPVRRRQPSNRTATSASTSASTLPGSPKPSKTRSSTQAATKHIQQNVEMLLAFTLSVEKNCGISSRLLWTESGEPLAQKLIDRLQRVN